MPRPRITVRSKTTGLTAEIAPSALPYFPDYEPAATTPEQPPTVTPDKSARKRPAATNTTEKE